MTQAVQRGPRPRPSVVAAPPAAPQPTVTPVALPPVALPPVAEVQVIDLPAYPSPAAVRAQAPTAVHRSALLVKVSRIPHLGINAGIVLTAVGVVLIVFGWGRSAGLTVPGEQIPYLLGAGLPGLGLVVVGMATINLTMRRNESRTRHGQIVELTELLEQLRAEKGDRS